MRRVFPLSALFLAWFCALASAQFYQQAPLINTAGGSANALTFSVPNAVSLQNILNVVLSVTPASNNTSATTLNVNSIGPEPIKKPTATGLAALTGGELVANQPTQMYWAGSYCTCFVIVGNNFGAPPPATTVHGSVSFTSPGSYNFTVPANVYWLYATVTGGGGGADINQNYTPAYTGPLLGRGGCGGGTAIAWLNVTPGQVIVATVGAGGTGSVSNNTSPNYGSNPTAGANSTFSYLTGAGGASGNSTAQSCGGAGSGGQLNLAGQSGSWPFLSSVSASGAGVGGSSYLGAGGQGIGENGGIGAGGGGCSTYANNPSVLTCYALTGVTTAGNGGNGAVFISY